MYEREILEILKQIYDPDYRDKSIIDMGLVKEEDIKINGNRIACAMVHKKLWK